jgi:uncharacterized membrane protein YraQ (UPF0718 family)
VFQYIADVLTFGFFGLDQASHLGESVNFFIYDTLKIFFSILFIVFIISFIRTYFAPDKVKKLLSREHFGISNLIASLFGAISPFCSCSSVPLFIGFLEAGVPIGVAFSFLITSPLVNEIVFVLLLGTFGAKMAFIYAFFGILLGVSAGMILGRLKLDGDVINLDLDAKEEYMPRTFEGKLEYALRETFAIIRRIFIFIVIGVGIGAYIHGYIPAELIMQYVKSESILAVPIAVLIGVPIYAGCSTLVPVIFAFTQKGIAIGTALAFMMAVAGLSFPEAILLKSVMKMRLLAVFYSVVAAGIVLIGYLFNAIF